MNKLFKIAVASVALAGISAAAFAQSVGKPEDQVRWRQSGYQFMYWNMSRIKANLDGTFNKDQVIQAANSIAAVANSGMGSLYQPGTEHAKGFNETRAKPELFTDKEGVGKVGKAFFDAANDLAKVAATGDAAAVKTAYGKMGEACKGCHEKYRKEEKK